MRPIRNTVFLVVFFIFCQAINSAYGQLGISFDLKKPQQYDDRVLRSEKSDQKKFTLPTRIVQNTVTHYNYYFNAKNKLNEIIERAKFSFKDDYTQLLPFYNYSLDATARDKVQLDSVIYKSESGIALHDLRNDWADNLYLLWGAAFYLRKEFDSAYLMFQFINYAFAPKEKDGYYRTIGSSRDNNSAFSISTKEKKSLSEKIFTGPPSRNDAFIWQIRNFLAQDEFAEAASLIVALKNDPNFPKRLHNDLEEVQAYWFYKQKMWDSAAPHLVNALGNTTNKLERARWEYLAAQLYEMTGKYDEAEKYFAKAIDHTTDPVMDVYARLYSIRVNKSGNEKNYIDKNIAELLKMARKDKYELYRDIIYYMAAQMEMERNNVDAALALLKKSIQYNSGDVEQRNKAFLQLGELAFAQKKYREASNFYDSLKLNDSTLHDVEAIKKRKEILGEIASASEIIERQDSLQRIAAMPEDERKDFVKKILRKLRKEQGLKDQPTLTTGNPLQSNNNTSLFASNSNQGEWYFYNPSSLSKGVSDFKAQWGNRPNVDNWRRSSAIINSGNVNQANQNNPNNPSQNNPNAKKTNLSELTYDDLYDDLPLTEEKMKVSNDSLRAAMLTLGKLYAQELEDCNAAIETFENFRNRFPKADEMDEALFNLYYCYNKTGNTVKAEEIKKLLSEKFPKSNFTTIVLTGKNPKSNAEDPDATKTYEKIYDAFIEGNFADAIAQKKIADSLYGKNYWTPQLLYIEAVYYVKQRDDSTAKKELNAIKTQFPKSPLAAKATTLIDVLNRRNQIEEELNRYVIKGNNTDTTTKQPVTVITKRPADSTAKNPIQQPPLVVKKDTATKQPVPQTVVSPYAFNADASHYVVLILNKVDPVFANEAKNAFFRYNRQTYYNKTFTTDIIDIDAGNRLLLISPFKNAQEAMDYIDKARPLAASEIIPWLKKEKYIFSIITDKNLDLLKANKDLDNYKNFLNQKLPGKF